MHTDLVKSDKENDVMTLDNKTLMKIVAEIVRLAHPDRVILFGSAVTGSMTDDSDLDLLVIGGIAYPAHKCGKVLYKVA